MTAYAAQPGSAMLQAPTPDANLSTKILYTAIGAIASWLIKSFLMAGWKTAVVSTVTEEMDKRFKALHDTLEERFERTDRKRREDLADLKGDTDEKFAEIRDVVEQMAERRNLPRPHWRHE